MKKEVKLNYILPNLFTASSIFAGVLSIINASVGHYKNAAWLIILSLILDGLDGKIARLTKGESKFGVEFDSLADIVAFGVAPAMLIYFQIGQNYGKFGILASALFVVLGAIRLARFNITTSKIDASIFIGLPIPSAALFLVSLSMLQGKYNLLILEPFTLFSAIGVGLLMVSNIRYNSFKKVKMPKAISFKVLVALILLFSLLYLIPIEALSIFFVLYVLSGVVRAIYSYRRFMRFKR